MREECGTRPCYVQSSPWGYKSGDNPAQCDARLGTEVQCYMMLSVEGFVHA
jgi:hypothetical protein